MNITAIEDRPSIFKTWHIFLMIVIGMWINTWIIQNNIFTLEVYYNLLSESLDYNRIDDQYYLMNKLSIIIYFVTPMLLWFKLSTLTLLLQFPFIFKYIDIPFKKIFRIVTIGQIIYLISTFIKTMYLLRLDSSKITKATLAFVPLSITNFLDSSLYSKTSYSLLNHINLFELIWCIIICKGLISTEKLKKIDAALVVVIVWTIIMVFQWALSAYLTEINS